jgi:hypothetical protein
VVTENRLKFSELGGVDVLLRVLSVGINGALKNYIHLC